MLNVVHLAEVGLIIMLLLRDASINLVNEAWMLNRMVDESV